MPSSRSVGPGQTPRWCGWSAAGSSSGYSTRSRAGPRSAVESRAQRRRVGVERAEHRAVERRSRPGAVRRARQVLAPLQRVASAAQICTSGLCSRADGQPRPVGGEDRVDPAGQVRGAQPQLDAVRPAGPAQPEQPGPAVGEVGGRPRRPARRRRPRTAPWARDQMSASETGPSRPRAQFVVQLAKSRVVRRRQRGGQPAGGPQQHVERRGQVGQDRRAEADVEIPARCPRSRPSGRRTSGPRRRVAAGR